MANVFYRSPNQPYPVASSGYGSYLKDASGNEYLDGSGGAAVSSIGHGHPHVISAIKAQLDQMAFAHTAFFSNHPQEELAERLANRFWESDSRVFFVSGGSEANETAIKLARQYHLAAGNRDKHIVISRRGSYHGATLGALSLSGTPKRHGFSPLLHAWPKIAPCYPYREQRSQESIEEYGQRAARELELAIEMTGADNVAAFIVEPVVGSTLGAVEASPGYLKEIRRICDNHNVLVISDEVMCGSGRCGSFFASDEDDAQPDIISLGKGIAGGYQPLGATIARSFIHNAIVDRHGAFAHGHSYVGHATACAAGCAVLDVHETDDLLSKVRPKGQFLMNALKERLFEHPNIGEIRGRGLLIAVECVENQNTKEPLNANRQFDKRVKLEAMRLGLICYPFGGHFPNRAGGHVMLAPAFTASEAELNMIADRLSDAITSTLSSTP